jgi:hypothetical protein
VEPGLNACQSEGLAETLGTARLRWRMRGLTAVGTRLLHPRGLRVLGDGAGGVRNWHNGGRQAQGGKSSKNKDKFQSGRAATGYILATVGKTCRCGETPDGSLALGYAIITPSNRYSRAVATQRNGTFRAK